MRRATRLRTPIPLSPFVAITRRRSESFGAWTRRIADGKFHRGTFRFDHADDLLVLGAGDKDELRICMDLAVGATRSSTTFANLKWDDFSPTGSGTGGVPPRIGDDYVLLVRGKDGKAIDARKELKADDVDTYIGVRLRTK